MDADFKNEVEIMRQKHKQNKDQVLKMLIENIFNVENMIQEFLLNKKENIIEIKYIIDSDEKTENNITIITQ